MRDLVTWAPVAGRYRLLHPLGEGGMGRVWLARDEMLGRDVAVKEVTLPAGVGDAEHEAMRLRALREARAAARLSHPNVVRIYDAVRSGEQPWIVMEYVPSRSLDRVISEDGPLPAPAVARIGIAVLDALTAAHLAGVLHRDVKPGNVLLATDGRVVLTDFGLATFDGAEGALTVPGLVIGSVRYIPPERARDGTSTPESDLWALGATLYAAVEGQAPYERSSAAATLMALATKEPRPPRRAGPLRPVLAGLLRRNPRERLRPEKARRMLLRAAEARGGRRGETIPVPPLPFPAARTPAPPVSAPPTSAPPVSAPPVFAPPGSAPPVGAPAGSAPPAPATTVPMPVPLASEPAATVRLFGAPHPVPAGARRTAGRAWLPVALVAIAVLATLATLVATLTGGTAVLGALRGHGTAAGRAHAAAAGGDTRPAVDATPPAAGCPAGTPATLPLTARAPGWDALGPGWVWYRDPAGFRLAVPAGWPAYRGTAGLCLAEPRGSRVLGVLDWPHPGDPLAAARVQEAALLAGGHAAGYQRVRLARVAYYLSGADWEYTILDGGTSMHVVVRDFLVAPGRGYTVVWVTPDFDWQLNLDNLRLVTASFTTGQ